MSGVTHLLDPKIVKTFDAELKDQWKVRTEMEEAFLRDELDSLAWEKIMIKGRRCGTDEWEKLLAGQYDFVAGNDGNCEFTVDNGINWDDPKKSEDLMWALKTIDRTLEDVAITEKKCLVKKIWKSGKVETRVGQLAFVWSLWPASRVQVVKTPLSDWVR